MTSNFLAKKQDGLEEKVTANESTLLQKNEFLSKKKERDHPKKTYLEISDRMWNDLVSSGPFSDMPDDYRDKIYSDGVDHYVEFKGKKIPLDGKALLKILSLKKKSGLNNT